MIHYIILSLFYLHFFKNQFHRIGNEDLFAVHDNNANLLIFNFMEYMTFKIHMHRPRSIFNALKISLQEVTVSTLLINRTLPFVCFSNFIFSLNEVKLFNKESFKLDYFCSPWPISTLAWSNLGFGDPWSNTFITAGRAPVPHTECTHTTASALSCILTVWDVVRCNNTVKLIYKMLDSCNK